MPTNTDLPDRKYSPKNMIEYVQTESGAVVYLNEMECMNGCGTVGCLYLAISDYGAGFWAFCSHECRMDGLKIGANMEPPTAENMAEAGLYFVSPQPES